MLARRQHGTVRRALRRGVLEARRSVPQPIAPQPIAPHPSRSMCDSCLQRNTCKLLRNTQPSVQQILAVPEGSHHQRVLPSSLVAFSSPQGRHFFQESLRDGQSEAYFPLAEQYVTQSEVAFCGLASLTMVMNALRIDPQRIWKDGQAPGWRWWTDEMFPTRCSGDLERLRAEGTTLDQFNLLALANGAEVTMRRASDPGESLETFRKSVVEASEMRRQAFLVVSFCRSVLDQTGSGHFSPIGGYHAGSDSVLVLDVARFKYPAYWVPVEVLWRACDTTDPCTGRSRGWFHLAAA